MGYAEGNTHGFTREDAKIEEMDAIFEILSTNVETILDIKHAPDSVREDWEKLKIRLTPHIEYMPFNWHTDKYGNEVCEETTEFVSYASTYEDEIADICWLAGFDMSVTQDYVDGSPTYCISLPDNMGVAEKNMKEAQDYWNEVYN